MATFGASVFHCADDIECFPVNVYRASQTRSPRTRHAYIEAFRKFDSF